MRPRGLSLEAVCGAALLIINGFSTLIILNFLFKGSKSVPGHGSISGLPRARRCHDSDAVFSSLDNERFGFFIRQSNLLWTGGSDLCWGSHGVHPVASSSE